MSSVTRQRRKGLSKPSESPYDAFLAYVVREKAQKTLENYTRTLKAFEASFPSPFAVSPEDVRAWIARPLLDGSPRAATTRRTEVGCLKALWRFLHETYDVPNVMAEVPFPPRPQRLRPSSISRAQVNDMLSTITTDHQRALALLMADAGLRVSEACNLPRSRVHIEGKRRYLSVLGKGDKERLVPIGNRLVAALAVQVERSKREGRLERAPLVLTRTGRPYTRGIVWEFIAVAGLRAGIEDMHPHRLRHSWACWLHYERHVPLGMVSRLLGHASLSTTQDYLGLRQEEIFNALEFLND